ncbi:hypothetical protein ACLWN1_16130, partial [Lactiplantibacillus plantarum]|uniref:hypothetical protein n=1 Tax=Lactiplantibacillus plantarum TaxID=1590 RepID=UPI0039A1D669
LSDSLVSWGLASSTSALVDKFTNMLSDSDATGIAGGAVVGCVLMFFMILGLLMVMLMLIVMLITLYFSGVLFPLGWVWIVDKNKRAFGSKIAYLWLGTLAAHPLLFFLLGIVFSMVAANVDAFSNQASLQKTVTLVVSILSLLIAGFAPLLLFKFAPVLPMGGAGAGTAGGPPIGAKSMQEADSRYGD